ncbi:hypothetical protein ACJX0J_022094, partial [Zea mays]
TTCPKPLYTGIWQKKIFLRLSLATCCQKDAIALHHYVIMCCNLVDNSYEDDLGESQGKYVYISRL